MRIHVLTFLVACSLAASPALAEVWGYIDDQGRPHVATEKRDARYQLFFKGSTQAQVEAAKQREARAAELEALAQAPIFQRLTTHPDAQRYDALIARLAKANGVDAALVKAIIAVESGYDPAAVSPKGALGLMQVIPETAARYGVVEDKRRTVEQKLFDPTINIGVGARYLRDLLEMFEGDLALALAAYNAGEATVHRYDRSVPPYAETQDYVKLVTQVYAFYKPPPVAPPARVTIPKQRPGER